MADVDELFWGGYLSHLIQAGEVTAETPRAEVNRIKAGFMDGLNGSATPATEPKERG